MRPDHSRALLDPVKLTASSVPAQDVPRARRAGDLIRTRLRGRRRAGDRQRGSRRFFPGSRRDGSPGPTRGAPRHTRSGENSPSVRGDDDCGTWARGRWTGYRPRKPRSEGFPVISSVEVAYPQSADVRVVQRLLREELLGAKADLTRRRAWTTRRDQPAPSCR